MNSFAVSFIFTCLSVCQQESSAGAVVTGITQLQPLYDIDNNVVSCQATKSPDGHTYIAIVTPKDAWTKELIITSSTVFGYSLKCGDKYGEPMSGLNSNAKMNIVDLGISNSNLAIQFKKAKTFGILTDYGTLNLPAAVNGHLIVFFWPNDSEGDHWNHFLTILNTGEKITQPLTGIAANVVQVGTAGASLSKLFGL